MFDPENTQESEIQLSTNRCHFYMNYKLEYMNSGKECRIERFVKSWVLSFTEIEFSNFKNSIQNYLEKIGTQGQIVKSVNLCGLLAVVEPDNMGIHYVETLDNEHALSYLANNDEDNEQTVVETSEKTDNLMKKLSDKSSDIFLTKNKKDKESKLLTKEERMEDANFVHKKVSIWCLFREAL